MQIMLGKDGYKTTQYLIMFIVCGVISTCDGYIGASPGHIRFIQRTSATRWTMNRTSICNMLLLYKPYIFNFPHMVGFMYQ